MKKFFVTLMAACLVSGVMAVDRPKQGFGLQIGWAQPIIRLNSPNLNYPSDSLANTVKLKGFKFGLVYDASYIAGFGSSISLNYTFGLHYSKWNSLYENNVYPRTRTTIMYHQLELAVDWQYKFEIAKETYLILYTGPTLQCGLVFNMRKDMQDEDRTTGEIKTIEEFDWIDAYNVGKVDEKTTEKYKEDNALNRLNITWGVGAGFQYKRYFLRGGYDFGLVNPYKHSDFVNGRHTRGRYDQWSIKLGVYLWYHE